jgi:hypothetical protein
MARAPCEEVPAAELLFHRKRIYDDGAIVELRIWVVPAPVRGSVHRLKYSLFYGRNGERLVGYDNEAGKGDHRHRAGREDPYVFRSVDQLVADFLADVAGLRGGAI